MKVTRLTFRMWHKCFGIDDCKLQKEAAREGKVEVQLTLVALL